MRPLPTPAVFTYADAQLAGWTHTALKHAVATGRLIRLRRGVYTSIAEPGPVQAAIGASLAVPNAVVSDRSATILQGLPLIGRQPPTPELTVRPRGAGNVPGIHLHRAGMRRDEVCHVAGVPVTSIDRTLIDVARNRPTPVAVVAIDAALHERRTTRARLDHMLFGVVGEADGRSKYDGRPVITKEKDRQELLEDPGLVVVRWTWEFPTSRPQALRSKILRAFDRGARRDRSGFPRLWRLDSLPNSYNCGKRDRPTDPGSETRRCHRAAGTGK